MSGACCVPGRDGPRSESEWNKVEPSGGGLAPATLVTVPAGRYRMGDESEWSYPGDGEGPVHEVELTPFRIDRYAVTNRQFNEFVDATGWAGGDQALGRGVGF